MKKMAKGLSGFRPVRRRGSVLIEFVMVIPLLATILGLTFFFGWAMVNQQHVKVADRFQTWRKVREGSRVGGATLNERLFMGHLDEDAYDEDARRGNGHFDGTQTEETFETFSDLTDKAQEQSEDAGTLAGGLLGTLDEIGEAERGRATTIRGEFPSDIGIFQSVEDYQGAIKHTHIRDGKEWRWRQLRCEEVLKDEFLSELDDTIKYVASPGDDLAEIARDLYRKEW
jgi:hypothetical protein